MEELDLIVQVNILTVLGAMPVNWVLFLTKYPAMACGCMSMTPLVEVGEFVLINSGIPCIFGVKLTEEKNIWGYDYFDWVPLLFT